MFWGVFLVDRELIAPKVLDEVIPLWLSHCSHTLPFVFILAESLSVQIRYPTTFVAISSTLGGICVYLAWFVTLCLLYNSLCNCTN